jgi:hypothetical protein
LLAKIEEAGLIESDDSEVRVISSGETIDEDIRSLAGQFETLRTQDGRRLDAFAEYARTTNCRAVFLRGYFGEEADVPCGLCDICRGRPARPVGFFAPLAPPKPLTKKARGKRPRGGEAGKSAKSGRRRGRRKKKTATESGAPRGRSRRRRRR